MAYQPGDLAGTAFLTVDGVQYPVVGEVNWRPNGNIRETLGGADGPHGSSVKIMQGFIEAKVRDIGANSVSDFMEMVSVSVVLEITNGKTVSGNGMWLVGEPDVNSDEATLKLRFEGLDVKDR